MIRHFVTLTWNRKRGQLLLGLELLVCFLLIAAVATFAFRDYLNFRRPLGYQVEDVWTVGFGTPSSHTGEWTPADSIAMQQAILILRSMPEVVAVAENPTPPLSGSVYTSALDLPGHESRQCYYTEAGMDLAKVLRLDMARGRWFDGSDLVAATPGFVINEGLALAMHGSADPIGKPFTTDGSDDLGPIIGVVSDYRQLGRFEDPHWSRFRLVRHDRPLAEGLPTRFMIRLQPGTPRQFERELRQKLNAAAPGWHLDLRSMEEMHAGPGSGGFQIDTCVVRSSGRRNRLPRGSEPRWNHVPEHCRADSGNRRAAGGRGERPGNLCPVRRGVAHADHRRPGVRRFPPWPGCDPGILPRASARCLAGRCGLRSCPDVPDHRPGDSLAGLARDPGAPGTGASLGMTRAKPGALNRLP